MSTRSIIAKKTDGGFVGTYHHFSGYPAGIGEIVAKGFNQNGWKYVDYVLEHNWSNLDDGICYCCGTMRDGRREPYITHTNEKSSGAEWAYVFDKVRSLSGKTVNLMHIYEYRPENEPKQFDPSDWVLVKTINLEDPLPDFAFLENEILSDAYHG